MWDSLSIELLIICTFWVIFFFTFIHTIKGVEEMDRELLLMKICPNALINNCRFIGCAQCNVKLNEWLDEYDKHVIEQYKADTNLKDTIREIHDNVAQEMYCKGIDDFAKKICEKYTEEESKGNYKQYCCEIKQDIADIAEQLKAGD